MQIHRAGVASLTPAYLLLRSAGRYWGRGLRQGAPAFFVLAVSYLGVHTHLLGRRMLVVAGLVAWMSLIS